VSSGSRGLYVLAATTSHERAHRPLQVHHGVRVRLFLRLVWRCKLGNIENQHCLVEYSDLYTRGIALRSGSLESWQVRSCKPSVALNAQFRNFVAARLAQSAC
jgi:hypothetical protein